jgi:hypothetical protein
MIGGSPNIPSNHLENHAKQKSLSVEVVAGPATTAREPRALPRHDR